LEGLAKIYHANGRFPQAIACLKTASLDSPDPHLSALLAMVYTDKGELSKAKQLNQKTISSFKQALVSYPHTYAGEASEYFLQQAKRLKKSPIDKHSLLMEAGYWAKFDAQNRPTAGRWLLVADIYIRLNEITQAKLALTHIANPSELKTQQQQQQVQLLLTKLTGL